MTQPLNPNMVVAITAEEDSHITGTVTAFFTKPYSDKVYRTPEADPAIMKKCPYGNKS